MGTLTLYAVKVAVCLTLLYLPYAVLLRRETFFGFNRSVLLMLLAASFVLPLVHLPVPREAVPVDWEVLEYLAHTTVGDGAVPVASAGQAVFWTWADAVVLVYIIGVVASMAVHIWNYMRMFCIIRGNSLWIQREEDCTIHCHPGDIPPFSWMDHIMISQKDYEECGREILLHERAHVSLCHSWDTCFVLACKVFQWFNPCVWLLEADLRDVHEYEADRAVLRSGADARNYQLMIRRKAVGDRSYNIANSLTNSNLKKRIKMMNKNASSPWRRLRLVYVLPVAAFAVTAFARPEAAAVSEQLAEVQPGLVLRTSPVRPETTVSAVADTAKVTVVRAETSKLEADIKPENIKHVTFVKNKGLMYIETKDGTTYEIPVDSLTGKMAGTIKRMAVKGKKSSAKNRKITLAANPECKAAGKNRMQKSDGMAAVRADKMRVRMKKNEKARLNTSVTVVKDGDAKVVIDGKPSAEESLCNLKSDRIKSITVLKDEAARAAHGAKDKKAVIIVNTEK